MPLIKTPLPELVETEERARQILNNYTRNEKMHGMVLGLDTETTGRNIARDEVIVWSLADADSRYCITRDLLPVFKPMLEDPLRTWALTNAKFDCHMMHNSGINLNGRLWCTLVLDWLLDEEHRWGRHGLKETAEDHLGYRMLKFNNVFPKTRKQNKRKGILEETTAERILNGMVNNTIQAVDYSSADAWASRALVFGYGEWPGYIHELQQILMQPGMSSWDFFQEYEVDFTRVLFNMERRGMLVWPGYLEDQAEPMIAEMDAIQGEFAQSIGKVINLNSHPQVGEFFVDHLGAPVLKMTSGGSSGIKKPSTDEEVLKAWAQDEDSKVKYYAKALLEFRSLAKTYGTYIKGILKWTDDELRIHTTLNHTGARTGRLSSRDPNLQNLPNPERDKFGIRQAFISPPGKILIVADYAQLEMRLMAHFSGDEKMIGAILDGLDMHAFTASVMLGVNYEDVVTAKKKPKDELTDQDIDLMLARSSMKAVGFGIIYGEGPQGLAAQLDIPFELAKKQRNHYLNIYPGVNAFINNTIADCHHTEYVQTLLGRYRRLPAINSGDHGMSAYAERQAVNSIIQGSAADTAKKAMLACEFNGSLRDLDCKMLMQIHDELVFEIPEENAEEAVPIIRELMENTFDPALEVPLPVDVAVEYSWGDAK